MYFFCILWDLKIVNVCELVFKVKEYFIVFCIIFCVNFKENIFYCNIRCERFILIDRLLFLYISELISV